LEILNAGRSRSTPTVKMFALLALNANSILSSFVIPFFAAGGGLDEFGALLIPESEPLDDWQQPMILLFRKRAKTRLKSSFKVFVVVS
jgi:hypothetical protein